MPTLFDSEGVETRLIRDRVVTRNWYRSDGSRTGEICHEADSIHRTLVGRQPLYTVAVDIVSNSLAAANIAQNWMTLAVWGCGLSV